MSVTLTPQESLRISVTDPTDIVELPETFALKEADGYAIFATWLDYLTDAAVDMVTTQRDYTGGTSVSTDIHVRTLSSNASWKKLMQFVVMDENTILTRIRGKGSAAVVNLANMHIHRLIPTSKIWCFDTQSGGGQTYKIWEGLDNAPYLCVVILNSGSGTFYLDDDKDAPTATREEPYDAAVNVGIVLLQQALNGSLKLRFPLATTLDNVWLLRYHGLYYGNE